MVSIQCNETLTCHLTLKSVASRYSTCSDVPLSVNFLNVVLFVFQHGGGGSTSTCSRNVRE